MRPPEPMQPPMPHPEPVRAEPVRAEPPRPRPEPPRPEPRPEPALPPPAAAAPQARTRPPRPAPAGNAKQRPRLVGAGAQRRPSRSAPIPAGRRGVQVDALDPKVLKMLELQQQILDRLIARLDLDKIPVARLGDEELWARAESAIVDLVETLDSTGEVPNYIAQDSLIKETLNEALGLGPLEDLLADDGVDEIIVDRRDRIIVSRNGQWSGSGKAFSSDDTLRRVVERMVAPTGQQIGELNPLVDVRLRDGSRLAAAVPPVAVRSACLALRKPSVNAYSLGELIDGATLSAEMGDFLTTCVNARRNVLICGAPGSGKSAVVAALVGAAPEGERIVSVEEVAELSINRDDWIALESRPGDGNGIRNVDLETVLRSALRMRPDRLVVGDVRGGEALELISAMASSSDGTIASITGDGAEAALARLAAMARLAAPGVSVDALRVLVAAAVDVVVHVARYADGVFRVAAIEEVVAGGEEGFETQQLFGFRGTGEEGGFAAAGVIPEFYGELEARGIPADTSIFRT